uniref:Uncharacterized protein n=1 Tax=Oryza punctata TaxID=4537 RepID=A0A0E0KXM3_ORYPU
MAGGVRSAAEEAAAGGEATKRSWPEVVGLPMEEAKAAILKDKPDADIVVLPVGSPVTRDLRPNRVRIFGSATFCKSIHRRLEATMGGGVCWAARLSSAEEKRSWPELEEVKKENKPDADIVVLPVFAPNAGMQQRNLHF